MAATDVSVDVSEDVIVEELPEVTSLDTELVDVLAMVLSLLEEASLVVSVIELVPIELLDISLDEAVSVALDDNVVLKIPPSPPCCLLTLIRSSCDTGLLLSSCFLFSSSLGFSFCSISFRLSSSLFFVSSFVSSALFFSKSNSSSTSSMSLLLP